MKTIILTYKLTGAVCVIITSTCTLKLKQNIGNKTFSVLSVFEGHIVHARGFSVASVLANSLYPLLHYLSNLEIIAIYTYADSDGWLAHGDARECRDGDCKKACV